MNTYFFARRVTGTQLFPGIEAKDEQQAKDKLEEMIARGEIDSDDIDYDIDSESILELYEKTGNDET